jgi:cell pole-organizing protein PopZ
MNVGLEMTKELVRSKEDVENLSMEEILASIRGIINDDMMETKNQNSEKKEEKAPDQEDVLELTDVVEAEKKTPEPVSETPVAEIPVATSDAPIIEEIKADEIKNEEKAEPTSFAPEVVTAENTLETELTAKKTSSLISEAAAHEASDAMKDLLNKTSIRNHSDGLSFRSGITVEDLVIETMKPYLTKWLDDNLPSIVKNLVQKEIQKLARDLGD